MTAWLATPWFAYAALMALQLKVAWGAWRLKDLTFGDTCAYFLYATFWREARQVNIAWSPLYTVFYGTVLEAIGDTYAATILHRLLLALAAGVLVLALMRRLLPPAVAWMAAAWWTVLPINFDTVYEVHLFAVLPILLAWLIVAARPGPSGRGIGVAIIGAAIVLSRNELLVPWLVLGGACVAWDLRRVATGGTRLRQVVLAYAAPLAAAVAVCVVMYARSNIQFPALWYAYGPKHTVNMCQVFAAGYEQRHPEWRKNAMIDCPEVMVRYFGVRYPTLWQMLRSNPRAVAEHFWWNLTLAPSGIQVLLFNAMSGHVNPDYFPVRKRSALALAESVVAAAVVIAGLAVLHRRRRHWWTTWFRARAGIWAFMILTVVPHSIVIILTQRPRPSYLFDLGVCLMAIVATCGWVLWCEWVRGGQQVQPAASLAMSAAMIALIAVMPCYYATRSHAGDRPLLTAYRRLKPFAALIERPDAVLLVSGFPAELAHYVGRNQPRALEYNQLGPDLERALAASLDARGVNIVYADENLAARLPNGAPFLDDDERARPGWKLLDLEDSPQGRWRLWARTSFLEPVRTAAQASRR